MAKLSYVSIGELLSNRDHTTILYSYEKVEKEIQQDFDFYQEIEILKDKILNES